MEISSELETAVEGLYAAFAAYPLRDDTDPCPCCHSSYDEQRLHAKVLRKLDVDDLRKYTADALFVWGGVDDFKHFLPRIFELQILYGSDFDDPQIALGKLRHSEWWSWHQAEQQAINSFLNETWACVLNTSPNEISGMEIEDWLCGIAQAEPSLAAYLKAWLATGDSNADLNLASFIGETGFSKSGQSPPDYWTNCPEAFAETSAWVRSDDVKARILKIASEYPEYDFVERAYTLLS